MYVHAHETCALCTIESKVDYIGMRINYKLTYIYLSKTRELDIYSTLCYIAFIVGLSHAICTCMYCLPSCCQVFSEERKNQVHLMSIIIIVCVCSMPGIPCHSLSLIAMVIPSHKNPFIGEIMCKTIYLQSGTWLHVSRGSYGVYVTVTESMRLLQRVYVTVTESTSIFCVNCFACLSLIHNLSYP